MLLISILICSMTFTIYADEPSSSGSPDPSFSMEFPVDGVTFRLYEIGFIKNDEFILYEPYSGYNVDLKDKMAPNTLAAYVQRDKLEPIRETLTENQGVSFTGLKTRIYLMIGETAVVGDTKYIPSPVLFSMPQQDEDGNIIWNVVSVPKYTKEHEPIDGDVGLTVEKIWDDKGHEKERPVKIRVQLLKDGEVYDTVELSKTNNWKYTWEELDKSYNWTVVEENVQNRYRLSIERSDDTIVLVNKYRNTKETPTPTPTNPNIPYTGQLWWPVGILTVIGIGLVLVGLIRRKRSE